MNLGFGRNYVINLERHKHRRDRTLDLLGIENTTVVTTALDGQVYQHDKEFIKENLAPVVVDILMVGGLLEIICCALSHRMAWKQFLDSGDETACFFEDDIVKTSVFNYETIEEIRDGIEEKNWGCIFLGKYNKRIKLVDDRDYRPLHGNSTWGAYRRFMPNQWDGSCLYFK